MLTSPAAPFGLDVQIVEICARAFVGKRDDQGRATLISLAERQQAKLTEHQAL